MVCFSYGVTLFDSRPFLEKWHFKLNNLGRQLIHNRVAVCLEISSYLI
jgi:hypothetical protein